MTGTEQLLELFRLGHQDSSTAAGQRCNAPGTYCRSSCVFSGKDFIGCTNKEPFQLSLTELRTSHPELFI
jgi:hypothetical protein